MIWKYISYYINAYVSLIVASPSVDKLGMMVTLSYINGDTIGDFLIDKNYDALNTIITSLVTAFASLSALEIWVLDKESDGYIRIIGIEMSSSK